MTSADQRAASSGSAPTPWALRIPWSEVDSLGPLRLAAEAEACREQDWVWVRGPRLDEGLARALQRHPHAQRFAVLDDGQLVSPGALVPRGKLPLGPWTPLRLWLQPELPPFCDVSGPEALRLRGSASLLGLQRGGQPESCNVLLTTAAHWRRAARDQPLVRLQQWRFAASRDGRIVVRGVPLPELPGTAYVERAGLAVPAGWTWFPAVDPEFVRRAARVESDDLLLWHVDQSWERLSSDDFTAATRGAIRASCAAVEEVLDG